MDDVPTSAEAARLLDTMVPEIEACTDEAFLLGLASKVRTRAAGLKAARKKIERAAKLAPWKDEAKRWSAGQYVYFGDGWTYSSIDWNFNWHEGADIPKGQRAKVSQVGRDGVWLTLPKKVKVAHRQRGLNLQWVTWNDIMHRKVSRVPLNDRPEGWRP